MRLRFSTAQRVRSPYPHIVQGSTVFSTTEEGPQGFEHLAVPGAGLKSESQKGLGQPSVLEKRLFGGMGNKE